MPNLEDHKKPDGSFDSESWNKAYTQEREDRKQRGELCIACGALIIHSSGLPARCRDCRAIDEPGSLDHHAAVRCPKCGHHWKIMGSDDYELFHEGTHDVTCGECDHEFEVETSVTYSFRSPERQAEKGGEPA